MNLLRRIDARWLVLVNNALLLFWGLTLFGLQRSPTQIASCLLSTVSCELLLARLTHDRRTVRDRLLSSATAAVSTLVLLVSADSWFYALAGIVAIASKYAIRDSAGHHVFNPTNFAIVASVALLPDHLLVRPDQFSGSPWLMAQIALFGLTAVVRGARFRTTLGYYLAVAGFALPAGLLLGIKPLWILAPELNTSTLIFTCLMITDPRTTPEKAGGFSGQWSFGFAVGVVHLCLRYLQVPYSPFIALFVVAGARSLQRSPQSLVRAAASVSSGAAGAGVP
jgi:hypothetical protein